MKSLKDSIHDLWAYIERELPDDLDVSAYVTGALRRRKAVRSATDLLRLILTYGVTDLPLKGVAAWASSINLADITGQALFFRVKESREWLSQLISTMLNDQARPAIKAGCNVVLVDATCISGPRPTGTQWRLHTEIAANTGHITAVKLTDASVGEGYQNYSVTPGDILVGDRAYATAKGIDYVTKRGGYVLARANLFAIRICHLDGTVFTPTNDKSLVPDVGEAGYNILIPTPPEKETKSHKPWKLSEATSWIPARLLVVKTINQQEIWAITTIPEEMASNAQVMEMLRVRWQIELEFKRLKSLLALDALPSRNGPTAQSWILARLLAAILVEKLLRNSGAFSPWGYRLRM